MLLIDVFVRLIGLCAGELVSAVFASDGWSEGPRRAVLSGRDLREVMVAHLFAFIGVGGVMCALAAVLAFALHGVI